VKEREGDNSKNKKNIMRGFEIVIERFRREEYNGE
jgi:hypothetical protein